MIAKFAPWFVVLIMGLASTAAPAEPANPEEGVFNDLIQAVSDDDNEAYRAARGRALGLGGQAFDRLLAFLESAATWQALVVHDALRVRRQRPEVAEDFDVRLDRVREEPVQTRAGDWFFVSERRGPGDRLLRTPEHEALRLEAVLTERADLPPDQSGRGLQAEGWIVFRRAVFWVSAENPDTMKKLVRMLDDMPVWVRPEAVTGGIRAIARTVPGSVDEYVPDLLDAYPELRRRDAGTYLLIRSIGEAESGIALPALEQIRDFERTEEMPRRGFEPWDIAEQEIRDELDELQAKWLATNRQHRRSARAGLEEELPALVRQRQDLERRRAALRGARRAQGLWDELNELIDRHEGGNSR